MASRPMMLYASLIVAALSVTLLSLTGVAALTGHLPSAAAASEAVGLAKRDESAAADKDVGATVPACTACGVVQSVRVVQSRGTGSGLGAVAGGVLGAVLGHQVGQGNGRAAMTVVGAGGGAYVGNEIEKDAKRSTSYEISVRLDNGRIRVLYQRGMPTVEAGDRVRIVDGTAVPAG